MNRYPSRIPMPSSRAKACCDASQTMEPLDAAYSVIPNTEMTEDLRLHPLEKEVDRVAELVSDLFSLANLEAPVSTDTAI